jgi:hypothetical protein
MSLWTKLFIIVIGGIFIMQCVMVPVMITRQAVLQIQVRRLQANQQLIILAISELDQQIKHEEYKMAIYTAAYK